MLRSPTNLGSNTWIEIRTGQHRLEIVPERRGTWLQEALFRDLMTRSKTFYCPVHVLRWLPAYTNSHVTSPIM